ncbi:MAG: helix-turn-helix domain-containing protein [Rhabdochlamydiaceae bacterium]|nr:helix-turn-helix domain-containing protein [Rhabdochlamydiaceae bacterium]
MSKHRGSNFEDFLKEEGIFEECNAEAVKRVIAFQLEAELKKQKMSKSQFAKKMKTSRSAVDRLLDPKRTCSLKSLVTAVAVLGKTLEVRMV